MPMSLSDPARAVQAELERSPDKPKPGPLVRVLVDGVVQKLPAVRALRQIEVGAARALPEWTLAEGRAFMAALTARRRVAVRALHGELAVDRAWAAVEDAPPSPLSGGFSSLCRLLRGGGGR